MITHRREFLFDIKFSAKRLSVLPLNHENWSDLINSGIACMSMKDIQNFTVHFPFVDLVTFTEGNFENLSIAARR